VLNGAVNQLGQLVGGQVSIAGVAARPEAADAPLAAKSPSPRRQPAKAGHEQFANF
jgi:hypothetical protein